MTQPDGYTLGNPHTYEPLLAEGGPLACKARGGAWFPTYLAAEAALENGHLPRCWFPAYAPIPGRVYALYDSKPDGTTDEVGAARLLEPARLGRATSTRRLDLVQLLDTVTAATSHADYARAVQALRAGIARADRVLAAADTWERYFDDLSTPDDVLTVWANRLQDAIRASRAEPTPEPELEIPRQSSIGRPPE